MASWFGCHIRSYKSNHAAYARHCVGLSRLLFQVLEQYEKWEEGGKTRKYGWLLTGSQALDTESWGNDFPVYHKVVYKHFQLGVGLFPYLRRNKHSKGELMFSYVDFTFHLVH